MPRPKKVVDPVLTDPVAAPVVAEVVDVVETQVEVAKPKVATLGVEAIVGNNKVDDYFVAGYFDNVVGKDGKGDRTTAQKVQTFINGFGKIMPEDSLEKSIFDDMFDPKDKFVLLKSVRMPIYFVLVPKKFSNLPKTVDNEYTELGRGFTLPGVSFSMPGRAGVFTEEIFRSDLRRIKNNLGYKAYDNRG